VPARSRTRKLSSSTTSASCTTGSPGDASVFARSAAPTAQIRPFRELGQRPRDLLLVEAKQSLRLPLPTSRCSGPEAPEVFSRSRGRRGSRRARAGVSRYEKLPALDRAAGDSCWFGGTSSLRSGRTVPGLATARNSARPGAGWRCGDGAAKGRFGPAAPDAGRGGPPGGTPD
jgi:hypothetical protein